MKRDEQRLYRVMFDDMFKLPRDSYHPWRDAIRDAFCNCMGEWYAMSAEEIAASKQFKDFVEKLPRFLARHIAVATKNCAKEEVELLNKRLLIDKVNEKLSKRDIKQFKEIFDIEDIDQ